MAEKTKDTLFIDMKYVILYRKLGYDEIAPDIFVYRYSDTELTIFRKSRDLNTWGKVILSSRIRISLSLNALIGC